LLRLEVKDGKKQAPDRWLTPYEKALHVEWTDAPLDVVRMSRM
jgi:hypothetical protein